MDLAQDIKQVMAPTEGASSLIEQLLIALCSPEFISVLSDAIASRIKDSLFSSDANWTLDIVVGRITDTITRYRMEEDIAEAVYHHIKTIQPQPPDKGEIQ